MKIRNGFVSNSSSSSFLVIKKLQEEDLKASAQLINSYVRGFGENNILTVDRYIGETEFGWSPQRHYEIGSKIVFAYMQAKYVDREDWVDLLEEVIKEVSDAKAIDWMINITDCDSPNYGYIDHQSASYTGENTEMFDSKEELINFLFGSDSFVMTDNDNR
jgi:hypothetical protein